MAGKITCGKLVRFGIIFFLGIIGMIVCLILVDIDNQIMHHYILRPQ